MSQITPWRRNANQHSLKNSLKSFLSREEQDGFYLRNQALEKFWDLERRRIRTRFSSAESGNNQHETALWISLEQHFRRVTCALILIEFNESLLDSRLSEILRAEESLAGDVSLPWPCTLAQQRLGDHVGERFYDLQFWILEPVMIGQPRLPGQSVEDWRRLPIEGVVDTASRNVPWNLKRVGVYRDYITDASVLDLGESGSALAETVHTIGASQCQDVAIHITTNLTEVDLQVRTNLGFIKRLRLHQNVARIYDTFIRDGTLYSFLPFPEYGDLDTLLGGGTQCLLGETDLERYDFRQQFPDADFRSMLYEFHQLMQALQHLDTVCQRDEQHMYSLQIEFHPKNVLVYPEAGRPVGRWKIFRFDLVPASHNHSDINRGGRSQPTQMVSAGHQISTITVGGSNNFVIIGDVFCPQPTSLIAGSHLTLDTSYRAPESSSSRAYDGQHAIVWSIGCMFIEILAFCRGFVDASSSWVPGQSDLRQLRMDLSGSHFYSFERSGSSLSYYLRDHVQRRLQEWTSDALWSKPARTAEKFLQRQPQARLSLSESIREFEKTIDFVEHALRNPQSSIARSLVEEQESDVHAAWTPNVNVAENVTRDTMSATKPSSTWSLKVLQYVVLLSEQVPGSSADDFWVQPLDPTLMHAVGSRYALNMELKWHNFCLEGGIGCALTKNSGSNNESNYLLFDLGPTVAQKLEFVEDLPPGKISMVVTAANGTIAFCYDRFIHLCAIKGTWPDNIPAVNEKAEFAKIALRNDGLQLFVYVLQGPEHVLQVWDIGIGRTPSHVADVAVERHDPHLKSSKIFIVPCTIRNTCIIIQNNLIMVAQAGGPNEARRQSGKPVDNGESPKGGLRMTRSALSLATYETSVLLVDNACTVRAYRINMDSRSPSLTMVGSAPLPIKNPIWAVITPTPTSSRYSKYRIVTGSASLQEYCFAVSFETSPVQNILQTLVFENLGSSHSINSTLSSEKSRFRRWLSGTCLG